MKITVYHGTAIEKADSIDEIEETLIFNNLSTAYSDLNALWFSPSHDVAEQFSEFSLNKVNGGIAIVLGGEMELPDEHIFWVPEGECWCDVNGLDYHVANDREELYQALQFEGYRAIIVKGNYPHHKGDDIAIFDPAIFEVHQVKVRVDGVWSKAISDIETLERIIRRAQFPGAEPHDTQPLTP